MARPHPLAFCLALNLAAVLPAAAHGPNDPPHQNHCMGDLLNPEPEAREMAQYLPDARYLSIDAGRPMGHVAGAGISGAGIDLQNFEIGKLLDTVTQRGKLIQ